MMTSSVIRDHIPDREPPIKNRGLLGWIRVNLFSTWYHSIITLLLFWAVSNILVFLFDWGILNAVWVGDSAKSCPNMEGACWAFITDRWKLIVYGLTPAESHWRINLFYALAGITALSFVISFGKYSAKIRTVFFVGFPVVSYFLLLGGILGLSDIEPDKWGGLVLTLVVACCGIFGSIPLGLMLALGRYSKLPVIHYVCAGFIEFWRGVPLIVVIVTFVALLPIFIPDGAKIDVVVRTLIAFAVFNSAYMAEVFRGGLQSISNGQFEASKSIGLTYWQMMGYIVLPQAIRNSVPALVNTCISVFKETTLILLIGFSDLLGIVQISLEDPTWLGPPHIFASGYTFVAIVFFIFCYGVSRYSRRLENRSNLSNEG